MFMPVDCNISWEQIRERKQQKIRANNIRENRKRIDHKYNVGDLVTLEKHGIITKASRPRLGPYTVVQTHNNGTVTIQKEPTVTDRVNIRRLLPFYNQEAPVEEAGATDGTLLDRPDVSSTDTAWKSTRSFRSSGI